MGGPLWGWWLLSLLYHLWVMLQLVPYLTALGLTVSQELCDHDHKDVGSPSYIHLC